MEGGAPARVVEVAEALLEQGHVVVAGRTPTRSVRTSRRTNLATSDMKRDPTRVRSLDQACQCG